MVQIKAFAEVILHLEIIRDHLWFHFKSALRITVYALRLIILLTKLHHIAANMTKNKIPTRKKSEFR